MKLFSRTALHAAVEVEPDLDMSTVDIASALRKRASDFTWEDTLKMQSWPQDVLIRLSKSNFPCAQAAADALTNIEHAEQRDAKKLEQCGRGFGGKGYDKACLR